MNIRELIEQLQAFPPDMPVLVDGYEGGLNDAQPPAKQSVVFNYRKSYHEGPHEEARYTRDSEGDVDGTVRDIRDAVIISRSATL